MDPRPAVEGNCPLCDKPYSVENNRTKHHVFPSYWHKKGVYGRIAGITVYACQNCHEKEFNTLYPMNLKNPWTPAECLIYWIQFCYSKSKDALLIYPQLGQCFT